MECYILRTHDLKQTQITANSIEYIYKYHLFYKMKQRFYIPWIYHISMLFNAPITYLTDGTLPVENVFLYKRSMCLSPQQNTTWLLFRHHVLDALILTWACWATSITLVGLDVSICTNILSFQSAISCRLFHSSLKQREMSIRRT